VTAPATKLEVEELVGRVRDLLAAVKALVEKRMFGGIAFLVNGNMSVTNRCVRCYRIRKVGEMVVTSTW
jgi:chaperonin GroEL (HSP60 family)